MTVAPTGAPPRLSAAYATADLWTRLHVRYRVRMTPFGAIEALVPRSGSVLDVGCGHGVFSVWLAESSSQRTVHGVDVSEAKLVHARRAVAVAGLGDRVRIDSVLPGWEPATSMYDSVVVNDVLYLLDEPHARRLLVSCCRALRPGGTLVVKEVSDSPRPKYLLGLAQEWIAVRWLGITEGAGFTPRPLDLVGATLDDLGWSVREWRLDRGYPYSHAALVSTSPR